MYYISGVHKVIHLSLNIHAQRTWSPKLKAFLYLLAFCPKKCIQSSTLNCFSSRVLPPTPGMRMLNVISSWLEDTSVSFPRMAFQQGIMDENVMLLKGRGHDGHRGGAVTDTTCFLQEIYLQGASSPGGPSPWFPQHSLPNAPQKRLEGSGLYWFSFCTPHHALNTQWGNACSLEGFTTILSARQCLTPRSTNTQH